MSHKQIEILEGAYVISDAHYSHLRPELFILIKDIHSKKLLPTQLILMGDIFDALFGEVPYTHKINEELITLINEINRDIEVIYLEGNHDFNLSNIFVNAKVIALDEQPLIATIEDKKICLAHGDFDVSFSYGLYSKVIRNSIVLHILKVIDIITNHAILKKLDNFLAKKDDCKEFLGFENFISKRHLQKYKCDYFIEGHFHQNRSFSFIDFNYTNLAAFACNQRYFIVKSVNDKELLYAKELFQGE